MSIKEMATFV